MRKRLQLVEDSYIGLFSKGFRYMVCLIIGFGSIGSRHASILKAMGCEVHFVTKRKTVEYPCYKSIEEALEKNTYDYIIVSNPTCDHGQTYSAFRKLNVQSKVLIEKPLFSYLPPRPTEKFQNIYVAYNFRFHPIIQKVKKFLEGKKLYSVQAYAGSYLPEWRPGTDYSKCYSAIKEKGGGVIRDLSHELDYINWFTGGWKRVSAIGGKFSNLDIDSDDIFALLIESEKCPVIDIQINYLDRKAQRTFNICLENHSVKADLIEGWLEMDGEIERYEIERNLSYTLMHESMLNNDLKDICSFEEGLDIVELIEAAEASVEKGMFIKKKQS